MADQTMQRIVAAFADNDTETAVANEVSPGQVVHDEAGESLFIDNEDDDDAGAAPVDGDYSPEVDTRPKAYNAMKLKGASKKRPFAPDLPAARKRNKSSVATIVRRQRTVWNTRRRDRSMVVDLQYLRILVANCQREAAQSRYVVPASLGALRTRLQMIALVEGLSAHIVEASKLLQDGGLLDIVNKRGANFTYDLCADSLALYKKWASGDYDSYQLRGIQLIHHTQANQKTNKSYGIEEAYPFKVSAKATGERELTNGQWWPLQACAVRDGAHGSLEAGISGTDGVACSVVMGSSGYSNIDDGETVQYCGTSGHDKNPTDATKMLLQSMEKAAVLRVIRSSPADGKKTNKYLPKEGLRYDGLYDVVSYEILDEDTAMHRFTLVRQPGQDPIRYSGDEGRPNPQELDKYRIIRKNQGLKKR